MMPPAPMTGSAMKAPIVSGPWASMYWVRVSAQARPHSGKVLPSSQRKQ